MTKQTRRKFSPEFKGKVALEAAKEQMTLSGLARKFEVNLAPMVLNFMGEFKPTSSATTRKHITLQSKNQISDTRYL